MKLKLFKYFIPFMKYPYSGEIVGCPVCSCAQNTQIANLDRRFKRLPTFACDNCGLLYTNPMPTDEELSEYYSKLYRLDYQCATDAPKERHLRKRKIEAESRSANLISVLETASRTLDFGCGTGDFITSMLSMGHDAHGLEPGQTYGRYAQSIHGERVRVQGWQQVSDTGTYDLVSCFHVLEHLRHPIAALKQMAEWTRPDGLVYIEVPDMAISDPNKGFGAFHFAHLTGFNHHNLLLAGSIAGLRPKVIVSPTGIIFEHGEVADNEVEATQGRTLSLSLYGDGKAVDNYFRYQSGKVFGRRRTEPSSGSALC